MVSHTGRAWWQKPAFEADIFESCEGLHDSRSCSAFQCSSYTRSDGVYTDEEQFFETQG